MVYKFVYSDSHDLTGYIHHSLSIFNTSDYKEEWGAKNENDPDICYYRGYRMPYHSSEPYDLSPVYWHVFAARLAFVVIFEHLVFVITAFMQFLIPDVPRELKTQMQREQLLAKEAKYQNGVVKAQEYEDLLTAIRDNGNNKTGSLAGRTLNKTSWGRKISRTSDAGLENQDKAKSVNGVWEIT